MSELVIVPSVEQINLEYRLAQNKAGEAVQHAINCGLMLLQVKASLAHGQWLPWLESQQQEGKLEIAQRTVHKYMRIASNSPREATLLEATSIRAALELLTEDKTASDQQAGLELETANERKAREDAENRAKAAEAKAKAAEERASLAERRADDFRQQDNAKLRTIREKEQLLETAQKESASLRRTMSLEAEKLAEAKILEVRAALNAAKDKAAKLDASVKSLKREREDAINRGVSNKLREKEQELNDKEAQLVSIEKRIAFLRETLDPLDAEEEATVHHTKFIQTTDHLINSIAVAIGDAFSPEYRYDLPVPVMRKWEVGLKKLKELQDLLDMYLNGDHIND